MQRYKGEETQHCLLHTACQDIAQSPIYGNLMVDGGIFNLCLGEVLGQITFRPGKNPATISSPPSSRHPLQPATLAEMIFLRPDKDCSDLPEGRR